MKKILEEDISQVNPFEERISPTALLACVGDNSGVPIYYRDCIIIDGYKESVDLLMKEIYSKEATSDKLVYPILFCCRHSIELSLKVLIKNFIRVYKIKKSVFETDEFINKCEISLKEHNIENLVKSVYALKVIDYEVEKVLGDMKYFEECLRDYFFDSDGDSFRYTYKRNMKKANLKNIRIIDLGVLYEKYTFLMKQFDFLIHDFCQWLDYQYKNNSFTKNLSRNQIEEISKALPNYDEWQLDTTKVVKENLCQKYNISNSELSKAIDIIKNHYKFCTNIGMEKKFKDIKEETFIKIGKLIADNKNKNRLTPKQNELYFDITYSYKYNYFAETFENESKKVFESINQDEKLVFLTFYEVSLHCIDGIYQCEELDLIYESWTKKPLTEDYVISKICNYLTNGRMKNAFGNCGQITYLKWFDRHIAPFI